MKKREDITNEEFEAAYKICKSKADFFKIIEVPNSTTWRVWFSKKQKELKLPNLKKGFLRQNEKKFNNSNEQFRKIVNESYSIRECLIKLKLKPSGANYSGFKKRTEELSIDTSHFRGKGYLKGKTHNWGNSRDIKDILNKNSSYSTSKLKIKLINAGILENKCKNCGLSDWLGKPISLHLDHINGINNDHRIENLRLLCPNCHSQTPTYAGKNKGKVGVEGLEPSMPRG